MIWRARLACRAAEAFLLLPGKNWRNCRAKCRKWKIVDGHHIVRSFAFPDFAQALAFVNKVGAIAEEQGHHPDIFLTWGKADVTTWTHKINGLTESDFIPWHGA